MNQLKQHRPEFINRIDEIVFRAAAPVGHAQVVDIQMGRLQKLAADKRVPELTAKGRAPAPVRSPLRARPLKRAIQHGRSAGAQVARGEFVPGDHVKIDGTAAGLAGGPTRA